MNSDVLSTTLLAGATGITVFTSLLPHLSEVRKNSTDSDTARDVRLGEAAASALIVGFGIIASRMTRSILPVGVSLLSAAILTGMYETVLRSHL